MTVDLAHFTPVASLGGGLIIGAAASVLVLLTGRIAGISGILGDLIGRSATGQRGWRLAFLAGLLVSAWIAHAVAGLSMPHIDARAELLVGSGLLVGYGTRLGSGCTSGHGVCGLSRLSSRSAVATAVFMAVGFATVFVVRHVVG
ncbi:MAG: hypothetical protein AMXMBFR64_40900 [Myxococcales bacterium]